MFEKHRGGDTAHSNRDYQGGGHRTLEDIWSDIQTRVGTPHIIGMGTPHNIERNRTNDTELGNILHDIVKWCRHRYHNQREVSQCHKRKDEEDHKKMLIIFCHSQEIMFLKKSRDTSTFLKSAQKCLKNIFLHLARKPRKTWNNLYSSLLENH